MQLQSKTLVLNNTINMTFYAQLIYTQYKFLFGTINFELKATKQM